MCSHYEAPDSERLLSAYGIKFEQPYTYDLWPGRPGPFVRRVDTDQRDEDSPKIEILSGIFGLLPHWAKDLKLSRRTYNARSETAAEKPSFRSAWSRAQHCIIPATAIYEPDWRSGKAVPTRITRKDGGLLSIAGLWEWTKFEDGEDLFSMTMLTVNADDHPLFSELHRPENEKRMVVILPNGLIDDWLDASPDQTREFMQQYPADRLLAKSAA